MGKEKVCPQCSKPMQEYVGFNNKAGDSGNPWDCVNKKCGSVPKKIEREDTEPMKMPSTYEEWYDIWGGDDWPLV